MVLMGRKNSLFSNNKNRVCYVQISSPQSLTLRWWMFSSDRAIMAEINTPPKASLWCQGSVSGPRGRKLHVILSSSLAPPLRPFSLRRPIRGSFPPQHFVKHQSLNLWLHLGDVITYWEQTKAVISTKLFSFFLSKFAFLQRSDCSFSSRACRGWKDISAHTIPNPPCIKRMWTPPDKIRVPLWGHEKLICTLKTSTIYSCRSKVMKQH